jgi:hypothetical protein
VAEQADAIRAAGATLGLWGNAVSVFDDLDVDVRSVGREAEMYFHGTSGQPLMVPEFGEEDHRYLLVHRASLNDLLAESVGYGNIRLSAAVVGFEEHSPLCSPGRWRSPRRPRISPATTPRSATGCSQAAEPGPDTPCPRRHEGETHAHAARALRPRRDRRHRRAARLHPGRQGLRRPSRALRRPDRLRHVRRGRRPGHRTHPRRARRPGPHGSLRFHRHAAPCLQCANDTRWRHRALSRHGRGLAYGADRSRRRRLLYRP